MNIATSAELSKEVDVRAISFWIIAVSALVLVSLPARADGGSCAYDLYSARLNQSYPVCQNVAEAQQCGTWPAAKVPANQRVMATAVGKSEGNLRVRAGRCDGTGAKGVCTLPTGELYFYEGDPKDLASGCRWMRGDWKPFVASAKELAEAADSAAP